MPPPRDFSGITATRGAIASLDAQITALGRELEVLRRKRLEAGRTGASATIVAAIDAAERSAAERRGDLVGERSTHVGRLPDFINALAVDALDPAVTLTHLDADVPVALLPVRIETRFEDGVRLRVRFYPDQIHVDQHDENVLASEVEIARRYWTRVWADASDAQNAWMEAVTSSSSPERAAYLVDRLQPTNTASRAAEEPPAFPDVETVAVRTALRAEARLLPSRWLVVLFGRDGKEICRKWAPHVIPDRLAISPFGDLLASRPDVLPDESAIDESARWLVDFGLAEQAGMALTIAESELNGARFAAGIGRLVVVGVDWTRTPDEASDALIDHLRAHGYSDGFELLRQGDPSNNTAAKSSNYRSDPRKRAAMFPPIPPETTGPADDVTRLAVALGSPAAAQLARFPGAAGAYEATVASLQTALWGAAFGFYFTEVMKPLLSEDVTFQLRHHLQRYVRPAGPLPVIRVGRQPYGVLPILSTPVAFRSAFAALPGGFERELAQALASIRLWVERPIINGVSEDRLNDIPTMTTVPAGTTAEDVLARILKMGPIASRAEVRATLGDTARANADKATQAAVDAHRAIVALILANLGVQRGGEFLPLIDDSGEMRGPPLIFGLVSPDKPRWVLDAIPWVTGDPPAADAVRRAVEKVREQTSAAASDPKRVRNLLAISANQADTLLEGLLLLSAAFEYWRAGERIVRTPEFEGIFKGSLVPDVIGIEKLVAPAANLIAIETPRQLLQLQTNIGAGADGVATSVAATIHHQATSLDPLQFLRPTKEFHDALKTLDDRPVAEIDHALRGLLDLGSHRLDAWISSMGTRRLDLQRQTRPRGVHIGAYGFVHDLAPDVTPDSEGYLHLPSSDHAVTAAVLRAGHMANRADKPDAFAIQLTSERVREALYISEGMAQGQRVSALLGYRFERWLIDGRLQAKYIGAFRKLAPHPADVGHAAGPQEAIAARDVVDGQRLAEMWRGDRAALLSKVAPLMQPPIAVVPRPDVAPLEVALDRLVALFDAFLDLWTCESVHQLARGNRDRAAAALAVIDRQERPPEPLSVQTPRKCWGYVQRLLWTMPDGAAADGWTDDLVSRIEPGANAMAARLIGPIGRFVFSAHVIDADGRPLATPLLAPLPLADLGLSPLSIVRLSQPTGRDRPTQLEERIATAFASRAPLPEGSGIALDAAPPAGGDSTAGGLSALLALLDAVRAVLFDRPPLTQRDFAPADGPIAGRVLTEPVIERAQALGLELEACETNIAAALPEGAAPDLARLRPALARASHMVPVAFWALTPAAASASDAELAEEGTAALGALSKLRARWAGVTPIVPSVEEGQSDEERAAHLAEAELETAITRIRLVFGSGFPVLPPFSLSTTVAAEWKATLGDQDALHVSHSKLAVTQWLRALSFVRANVRALAGALDVAAWTGHPNPEPVRVAQLPHAAGSRWAALPFTGAPPSDVRLSAVLLGEPADAEQPMVGLLLDEWTETIPERSIKTSVSFQYDAPAARPPQTICLAVNSGAGWSADALVDTVNELFDLARLRLLTPQNIAGHGAILPTVFIPQNMSTELPSFNLLGHLKSEVTAVSTLLGK
jgi:hypothetical protein